MIGISGGIRASVLGARLFSLFARLTQFCIVSARRQDTESAREIERIKIGHVLPVGVLFVPGVKSPTKSLSCGGRMASGVSGIVERLDLGGDVDPWLWGVWGVFRDD
jgi:hypothetical protein